MVWELRARDTGAHNYSGYDGIRHREYTTSAITAELWPQIPKIQYLDSGHGIIFEAAEHSGRRLPNQRGLEDHIREHMARLRRERREAKA